MYRYLSNLDDMLDLRECSVPHLCDNMHSMSDDTHTTSGVYAIYSVINGRTYVGSSVNFQSRWKVHRSELNTGKHSNVHLSRAWNLYGEDAFEFTILEACPIDQLLIREQHYLDLYFNSDPKPYNIDRVAGSRLGSTHSPETCAKMSVSRMGNKNLLGHTHTHETRVKMSSSRTGRKASQEHKDNISAGLMGREFSPEHRDRIGEANKRREVSDETKTKISDSNTGHKHTPETREKMRQSALAREARKREEKATVSDVNE